jgi:predicted RNA-binding Zn ribbon-like protein
VVSAPLDELPRYQRAVDGLVLPVAVATHPALDFCNTLTGWHGAPEREYLESYDHLVVWARESGLVDETSATALRNAARRDPEAARRALEQARSLRSALYRACTDAADRKAWDAVARETRTASAHAVLSPDGAPGRRWSVATDVGLERPVLEVAREAGDLLATLDLRHVRACPGTGCGWLFLDPRGRRRWCTMAVCGNRAKARRHASRARGDTTDV